MIQGTTSLPQGRLLAPGWEEEEACGGCPVPLPLPKGLAAPWSGHVDRILNETQREVLSQGPLEGSPGWELN